MTSRPTSATIRRPKSSRRIERQSIHHEMTLEEHEQSVRDACEDDEPWLFGADQHSDNLTVQDIVQMGFSNVTILDATKWNTLDEAQLASQVREAFGLRESVWVPKLSSDHKDTLETELYECFCHGDRLIILANIPLGSGDGSSGSGSGGRGSGNNCSGGSGDRKPTERVKNYVGRVVDCISSAWNYADVQMEPELGAIMVLLGGWSPAVRVEGVWETGDSFSHSVESFDEGKA